MSVEATRHVGRDPHDILGVPRGAGRQQVMEAFRRKARQGGHPDTGGDTQTFEDISRARDELLATAPVATDGASRGTDPMAQPSKAQPSKAQPRPASSPPSTAPPRPTSKLAIATGAFALLGPLFWPVAIVIGHVARRHIRRTGMGGGAFVAVALFFLYLFTLYALVRILTLVVVPS